MTGLVQRMVLGAAQPMIVAVAGLCVLAGIAVPAEVVADDWQVESGDERQQQIVERYRTMLEENPVEGMALDRLLGHIGRGAGLDGLISHYERRVESRPDRTNLRLVLGHLLKARGDYDEAFQHYDRAVELDSSDSLGWVSRGKVRLLTGDRREAMVDFEEALEREQSRDRRREILQELGELSFAQREFDRGKEFFDRLISAAPGDQYLRMEYVQLLVQYRQLDEAISQYGELERLVRGDTRQYATLLRDKADVYEMKGDYEQALETYEQAMGLVRSDSWLAREIRSEIVEVYRRGARLDDFLAEYGRDWRRGDSAQQMAVGDVYAELGRLEDALEQYRRLARADRQAIEPRQKVIRVLERMGRDDELPGAYRELMRAAPRDESHAFGLAEYYMRIGDRQAAREVLDEVGSRFSNRSYVLLGLAGYYGRWNFADQAQEIYDRVLRRETDDDNVLIEVGDFYFDRGDRRRAIEIWGQLPDSQLGRREGTRRQAEILVERGAMSEGIAAYESLLEEEPGDERLLRSMARALERANRWDEALSRWHQLLEVTERAQRQREARARIVELYDRNQELRAEIRRWAETLDDSDGDEAVEAGFFLAEAYLRLGDVDRAGEILQQLRNQHSLSDDELTATLLVLEQVHIRSERYARAIAVLEELSEHRPDMRQELLQRKSDHALSARSNDAAVEYAARALDTNPDDARAQARMGDVYRDIGDLESAVRHYETASEIDTRDFEIRFKLGRTLARLERSGEAEDVLMAVVENAREDYLVRDAGEKMLEMARNRGRLEALETRWAPLVFRMPLRQVHARLVFDLYDLLAGPLLLEAYHASSKQREVAGQRLFELGGRATTLMVAQLQSRDVGAQFRALRMIAEMDVDVATSQVSRLITSGENEELRNMAIVVAARLGDERFTESLVEVLDDGSATIRHLAIWALGYIDSEPARQALAEIADTEIDGTGVRLATLGLRSGSGEQQQAIARANLRRLAADVGNTPRHRAAIDLSVVDGFVTDGRGEEFRESLTGLVTSPHDRVGLWAARILGAYGDEDAATTLWKLALDGDMSLARRGEAGLSRMLTQRQSPVRKWRREVRFFDWTDSTFDAQGVLVDVGRQWSDHRRESSTHNWSDAIEQGLIAALRDGLTSASFDKVLWRISEQYPDREPGLFWEQERTKEFSRVVLDHSDGNLDRGTKNSLELLHHGPQQVLREVIDADDTVLRAVLRTLPMTAMASSDSGDETALEEVFVEALKRSDNTLRRQALVSLADVWSGDSVGPELGDRVIEAMSSQDTAVQLAAVRASGALGLSGASETLQILERDARPTLRRAVREAKRSIDGSSPGPNR